MLINLFAQPENAYLWEPAKWPEEKHKHLTKKLNFFILLFFIFFFPRLLLCCRKKKWKIKPTHNHLRRISDESKQQIAFILDKISALRPAEKLLLYLKMPGGHSDVGEYFTWSYQEKKSWSSPTRSKAEMKIFKNNSRAWKASFFLLRSDKKSIWFPRRTEKKNIESASHMCFLFFDAADIFDNDFILLLVSPKWIYLKSKQLHVIARKTSSFHFGGGVATFARGAESELDRE